MTVAASGPDTLKSIRHFHHLADVERSRLFHVEPETLNERSDRDLLGLALGATLYIPADRVDLSRTVARRAAAGVCSMVLDLEDSVGDHSAGSALENAILALDDLATTGLGRQALLFVRVRSIECMWRVLDGLASGVDALTGFVIPKFTAEHAESYLRAINEASERIGRVLYCMPVLETAEVLSRATRDAELSALSTILAAHRDSVLAVRVGATDMCGAFGIRRDPDLTIYDVGVVAGVIADIVNYLGLRGGTGHLITAPVWEYFADHQRMFRPLLRTTPFAEQDAVLFRQQLVSRDLDGLLRELILDRANGMFGKTVIHPSHVAAVHALAVVTHEEYRDATDILSAEAGGVRTSEYRNKMNEPRPHRAWAEQVLRRARVFGVSNPGVTFVDLLSVLAAA
jgi:citrate lyase beta subunit